MKKRTKIITTIASLCLAVALMAFGVYAATTASLGITSQVTFTATDVNVSWNISIVGGNKVGANEVNVNKNLNSAEYQGQDLESDSYSTNVDDVKFDIVNPSTFPYTQTEDDDKARELADAIDAGRKITYTFTITNNGENNITVGVIKASPAPTYFHNFGTLEDDDAYVTVVYTQAAPASLASATANPDDGWTNVTVAGHASFAFRVTLTLNNVTQDVTTSDIGILNVNFIAARPANFNDNAPANNG